MTRFIVLLLGMGCTKNGEVDVSWGPGGWQDHCEDTAAGACDTGAEEVADDGWDDAGGNPIPRGDSCSWGTTVCVTPGEPDNQAWCEGLGGTYSADACAEGYDGYCDIPGGTRDFTGDATAYYYGNSDPATACADAGGTYTPAI